MTTPVVTAIGLFSGGLDSILAVRVLQQQHIAIEAVSFVTPFFGPQTALKSAKQLAIPLHIVDITEKHFEMLKNPKHGYGRNMNPCIDCHALMFNQAGQFMKKKGAHFLFSGEVLGERPMSQNMNSLQIVARESGFAEYIVRPLSARLLPVTKPEQEGLVDRERLLDLQGRSRKPQIALAKKFGITFYPEPAGGCRLTNPSYSRRLRDLLDHTRHITRKDLELLGIGRHIRIDTGSKIIVGRNEQENARIESLQEPEDIILTSEEIPGPTVIMPWGADDTALQLAASVCVYYSDADTSVQVSVYKNNRFSHKISATACRQEIIEKHIIK